MKKSLAALALAGSIALVGAVPAVATNYPAPGSGITVSDGTVAPGQPITISAQGFTPGEVVVFSVVQSGAPLATGGSVSAGSLSVSGRIPLAPSNISSTANGNGAASAQIVINEPGTYAVTATGQTSGVTVGPVTVVVGGAALPNTGANVGAGTGADLANTGGTPLANTGADSSLILWSLVGAGALAAGTASVVVARRRAKSTEASA
ncbi:LPXTG cell wall anchor domain-containing protein [Paenarthrobacter ureafaciens]|uniref:LPXTG cell wall anchor domain-containing protein n=1 Tax=Paenarthrobacter ureafaciens TaxID=37931 RepID=UPI002DBB805C|nr:LPXTG cell wall anchor domain-containing protein [Paenarthrobacter ureafaciens]MEC3850825.1 LPXTG cell wall anchor domain-containing protein [Paenarthrobacter ureafaciens]